MKKTNKGLNFIKRAYLNVIRSKVRSIILIITFFVIGNFVIIGLGVSNATDNAKELTRKKMRAVVSYDVDYDEIFEYTETLTQEEQDAFWQSNQTSLRYKDLKPLLEDERVTLIQASSYSRTVYASSESNNVKHVPIDNDLEQQIQDGSLGYNPGDFFLKTNVFPNCIELVEGTFNMVDGEFYSNEDINNSNDVVVISKQLAEYNGLKVGDTITVYLDDPSYITDMVKMISDLKEEYFIMNLVVKGIYDHTNVLTPDKENYQSLAPYENPDNLIMVPASTLQKYTAVSEKIVNDYYASQYGEEIIYKNGVEVAEVEVDEDVAEESVETINAANESTKELAPEQSTTGNSLDDIVLSSVKVFLDDPLNVDSFVEDHTIDKPQFFVLNANNEEFKNLSKPLDTLNIYANLIIWLVVINAIVIITLVVALTLKTREYEIGVLLSIGASKIKVIGQFFVELAIVAIIGFTLSTFSGALISKRVGNTVLDYQIQRDEITDQNDYYYDSVWNDDYFTHITLDDLVSEYDSSISPIIIMEIYILGLGIVFISTLIPALMIMRFNPKKILMNQN